MRRTTKRSRSRIMDGPRMARRRCRGARRQGFSDPDADHQLVMAVNVGEFADRVAAPIMARSGRRVLFKRRCHGSLEPPSGPPCGSAGGRTGKGSAGLTRDTASHSGPHGQACRSHVHPGRALAQQLAFRKPLSSTSDATSIFSDTYWTMRRHSGGLKFVPRKTFACRMSNLWAPI
jgi:hypothetical protein